MSRLSRQLCPHCGAVQETGFFRSWGGSWDTPYGQFFLSWYSGVLIAHGERMVSIAASIFNTQHPQRCTLSNHRNSSQSIINAGPQYASRGAAQVSPYLEVLHSRHDCMLRCLSYTCPATMDSNLQL